MEFARFEHETERLRNELRMREANRDQAKSNWEMKEKQMQAMMQQVQFNALSWHISSPVFHLSVELDIISRVIVLGSFLPNLEAPTEES